MVKFEQFKSFLSEGKHDPGIFHAVFIAGGPGSGKDFVTHHIFDGHGLHEINSDIPFEHLLNKHGLDKTMPDSEKEQRNAIRDRAKHIADLNKNYLYLVVMGSLLMVLDPILVSTKI
jgi:cytidylate kinase